MEKGTWDEIEITVEITAHFMDLGNTNCRKKNGLWSQNQLGRPAGTSGGKASRQVGRCQVHRML